MTIYSHIAENKRRSFALLLVFIALLLAVGWAIDQTGDGYGFFVLAMFFSLFSALVGYYQGDRIALWTAGARQITKEQNPYLFRIVENLSMTAGLPMPRVHTIHDPSPNAFATGRDPKHASLAVTTGLLERLENEELEGVIAHELSHIGNYDIRFMTLVTVLVGAIIMLTDFFLRSSLWGMGGRRDNRSSGGILALVGLLLIILSPIIAQLIRFAVSRRREFLADASGALLTRYPEGLASALEKIAASKDPLQRASNATAHLYISNPFGATTRGMATMFSTHPPTEKRVKALREMGGERMANG